MALRPRIYYNAEQKAQMWDRWQKGESLNASRGLVRTGILISRGGGKFARFNRVFLIRLLPL